MKACPHCGGYGCEKCGNSGFDPDSKNHLPTCRICGKKDGACEWDGEGYSHLKCRESKQTVTPQIMLKHWWDEANDTEKDVFLMYLQSQGVRITDNEFKKG